MSKSPFPIIVIILILISPNAGMCGEYKNVLIVLEKIKSNIQDSFPNDELAEQLADAAKELEYLKVKRKESAIGNDCFIRQAERTLLYLNRIYYSWKMYGPRDQDYINQYWEYALMYIQRAYECLYSAGQL